MSDTKCEFCGTEIYYEEIKAFGFDTQMMPCPMESKTKAVHDSIACLAAQIATVTRERDEVRAERDGLRSVLSLAKCKHDTDGDGDCHICVRLTGGCPLAAALGDTTEGGTGR